jgi:Protein of unknown function (DUF2628)
LVVFNVYEPPSAWGDRIDRAERLVFIKDGFHWLAALVPALWLLVKGLWLELVIFLVGASALAWALEAIGVTPTASGVLFIIVQILIGFEASTIYGVALERRGWHLVGTVTGRDLADCERRFLEAWLASQPKDAPFPDGGSPPPNALQSWTQTALKGAKDAIAHGRRLITTKVGAKA